MRRKSYQKLEPILKQHGYSIRQGRKHVEVVNPAGRAIYWLPSTTSDSYRNERNAFAQLRRIGVIPENVRLP